MLNDNTNSPAPGDDQEDKKPLTLAPGVTFMANGVKYTVFSSFTIGRMEKVNLLEEELATFSNRGDCHKVMIEAMNLLNNLKQGEAYALLFNKVNSDRENARIYHFATRMCTAFINYEGEDLKYLTEEQITKKISDWSAEGLDARPFLFFAMLVYKELFENFKKDILNILTEAKSLKEALDQETDMRSTTENARAGAQG